MPNDTWIKIFRKLREHPIMRDEVAFHIFMWILICVDYKTGTMKTGRFWASKELGIKPRTFHKAVTERLRDRYNLVTLTSDNKKTIISVNNWSKYQITSDTTSDTLVTPKGHQSDTTQEYKNIRIKNINNILPKKIPNSKNSLTECTEIELNKIAADFDISLAVVKDTHNLIMDKIADGIFQKKKYGTTVYFTLRNWLRKSKLEHPEKMGKYVPHSDYDDKLVRLSLERTAHDLG